MVDMPQVPSMNISNKALIEMGRNSKAMENFTKAVSSKAGKELMAAIDQYNDVLKIAATIEAADKYADDVRKRSDNDVAVALRRVDQTRAANEQDAIRRDKLLDERTAKLMADIAGYDAGMAALKNRESVVGGDETQNELDLLENKNEAAKIVRANNALAEREAALTRAEADLKARIDRLNAAVA